MNPDPSESSPTVASETISGPLSVSSRLGPALLAGLVTSLVGALIWAGITMATDMQIGWMAVGVGILVGFGVGFFNREQSSIYGLIGAVFAVLGCLMGNAFTIVAVLASEDHVSFLSMLFKMDWSDMPGMLVKMFSAMDLVFYAIAVYEGYKFGAKGRL